MKNFKLPFLGLALALLIISCKKEDVQQPGASQVSPSKVSSASWNSLNNWSSTSSDNTTTFFAKLSDSSITANVVSEGMVLVYKKSGNDIQSLPFQEKDGKTYWYYQVSNGSLRVNSDNNSGQNLSAQSFSYFVITPQQLSDLEAQGKTKIDLLQLSYDQATALLK